MTGEAAAVRRRTVFYIEGYDPRGPAHYHALYRDEAARQASVNGLALTVGSRRRIDAIRSFWDVRSADTETRYVFLRYDDIMRARWSKTDAEVIGEIGRLAWAFLTQGVYAGMWRHAPRFLVLSLLAPFLLCVGLLASLAIGLAAGLFVNVYLAPILAILAMAGLLRLRRRYEHVLPAFWIGRACAFAAEQGAGRTADMDRRIDAFADHIVSAMQDGTCDEILVIGHSLGAQIGVAVCARVLARVKDGSARLSFLTLGQTIPLLALQRRASGFRHELATLAADRRLVWIDVSSRVDGVCFPLADPLAVCGLTQPDPAHPRPRLFSARFHTLFSPATYRRMKWDLYRNHFQYLMATERQGLYDYFRITAGPLALADHFGEPHPCATGHA